MATRTAPTFAIANITGRRITLSLVDASGDTYSESLYVDAAATDAAVEALVAAYQAGTQASVYAVTDTGLYDGDADPDNADVGQRNSIKDGINILVKNSAIAPPNTVDMRLVAPIADVMQGNQDIPLASATEMTALFTALLALKAGFSIQTVQFTERRERSNNPKVKI